MRPLSGISVLDVTQVVSGPFASAMLADLGADVVKIERPDGGDMARSNPPFDEGFSTYFTAVNRNKRSVALDLKSDEGQAAARSLAERADVVVENNPPGRMAEYGLGYETVSEDNEDVVYCSITGFGQTGPYRDLPALDIIVQAMSGVMSITGPPDGDPYRAGIPIADIASSMYAVQAIVLALFNRFRNGGGEYIDVSMLDCTLSWLTVRVGYTFGTGEPYPRMGNKLTEFVPYGVFDTDGDPVAVVVATDEQWRGLCAVLDRPELATDERFATVAARRDHRETLESTLQSIFAERPRGEWVERARAERVPVAPIYDTAEVWADEHVRSRGIRDSVDVDGGAVDVVNYPVRFERMDSEITRGPPVLGADTMDALAAAGYTDDEIEGFIDAVERYDAGSGD